MPIYEYRCAGCGHAFEKLIRSRNDLPDRCPACGKKEIKKLFSAFATKSGDRCGHADACAAAAETAGHRHSGGCCGGRCPL